MTTKRPTTAEYGIRNASATLTEMMNSDSNHELEWLWAAGEVTSTEEKLYALARTLYINPNNTEARRQYTLLARATQTSDDMKAGVFAQVWNLLLNSAPVFP